MNFKSLVIVGFGFMVNMPGRNVPAFFIFTAKQHVMPNKKPSKIGDLLPDNRNANKHSEFGSSLLQKSLQQNGLGRSILISSDNVVIAGNGVLETAGGLGIEDVQVIDTDGTKIIAVRRTDIKSNTDYFYNMALADNVTAKHNIVIDADIVTAIAEDYPDVKDWIEPATGKKPPGKVRGENLNHDERFDITLHFAPEDHTYIKDQINKSGVTAEQFVLNAVKAFK
jgi:hypothetical protein